MRGVTAMLFAACSAPSTAPLSNHATPIARDASLDKQAGCGFSKIDPNADTRHRLVGAVCDPIHQQWLVGATAVVTGPGIAHEQISVTDEYGVFVFAGMPDGDFQLTIYYADHEVDRRVTVPARPLVVMFDVP